MNYYCTRLTVFVVPLQFKWIALQWNKSISPNHDIFIWILHTHIEQLHYLNFRYVRRRRSCLLHHKLPIFIILIFRELLAIQNDSRRGFATAQPEKNPVMLNYNFFFFFFSNNNIFYHKLLQFEVSMTFIKKKFQHSYFQHCFTVFWSNKYSLTEHKRHFYHAQTLNGKVYPYYKMLRGYYR